MKENAFNGKLFLENLDHAIQFHEMLREDPHGIQQAVIVALRETRDALGWALKGQKTPVPQLQPKTENEK